MKKEFIMLQLSDNRAPSERADPRVATPPYQFLSAIMTALF